MNTPLTIPSNTSLFLRISDRKELVPLTQIVRLQSDRNYTLLFLADGRQIMTAKTLGLFEQALPSFFLRIHRSHIINFEYINHWTQTPHQYQLILKNGEVLEIAQRRLKWLMAILKRHAATMANSYH